MQRLLLLIAICCYIINASAQNNLNVTVRDTTTGKPLPGATVFIKETTLGNSTNENGFTIISGIPSGDYVVVISFIGYNTIEKPVSFPPAEQTLLVYLHPGEFLDEVIIESTRANKSIETIPTRTEVLTEEIEEAATMEPGRIAHLITHSTGIQVQQLSATSGYANVRIQGLDGKYALFLKDGFPLYGGFSGSLSIMHIPPLDLRQVEYIKGPASTLHGAGAISGLINLISKEPQEDGEFSLMFNKSHLGATNLNTFYGKRNEKIGATFYAGYDTQSAFDADKDNFSDIPQQQKFNFNPRLFFYFNEKTTAYAGFTVTTETRTGGDMQLISDRLPDSINFYREKNKSDRITTQVQLQRKTGTNSLFTIKNSFNLFDRSIGLISQPFASEYIFTGKQLSSFSEASISVTGPKHNLTGGINFYTDQFEEERIHDFVLRDSESQTIGGFVQHTWDITDRLILESGFRGDYESDYGFFPLPRISALVKWSNKLTTRASGAMGYSLPSIFIAESEILAYEGVLPVNKNILKPEESIGVNGDINYKTSLGDWGFFRINQLFFYNRIDDPLQLQDTSVLSGIYELRNSEGYIETKGFETSVKFGFGAFTLFVGYTFTDAKNFRMFENGETVSEFVTLTPQHSLKGDLLFDIPDKWQLAVDYEYKSSQLLSSGRKTEDQLIFGFIARRWINNWLLFINLENFTDVRQTRYESLINPPYNTPQFTEVWAPLDGFYMNGGFRVFL